MPKDDTEIRIKTINAMHDIMVKNFLNMIDTTIKGIEAGLDPIESLKHLKVVLKSIKKLV